MAAVLAVVLMPVMSLVAPAGMAGAAEAFTLTVEDGELLLRDAEEPTPLESPTTISGTNDGGVLKDGTFSTPPINFVLEVTEPVTATAEIEAVFTQTGPVAGTIDPDGNVALTLRLTVDLDIYVDILRDSYQCRTTPVVVTLRSEAPYEGSGVLAAEFSVPSTPTTDDCIAIIADAANDALLGGGHSLRLPVTGALTPPAQPGEATTTTLAVDPAESGLGDPVTLTATVVKVPGAENPDAVTGAVDFYDGTRVIGTADLDEHGKAELTLDTLGAGNRRIQARYRGVPEIWAASTSETVTHRVSATPFLSATLPATVQAGGAPVDLAVTVDNTGLGAPLQDARIDVAIRRAEGSAPLTPSGATPRISLSSITADTVTPITLTGGTVLTGTIGEPGGWTLPPGSTRVENLRLAVSDQTDHGPLTITFSLVKVTPGTGDEVLSTLATGADGILITEATRRSTTLFAGDDFFGLPAVVPTVVRQGADLSINLLQVYPSGGSPIVPTGTLTFFVDGQPALSTVLGGDGLSGITPPFGPSTNYRGGSAYAVHVPVGISPGTRQVSVRYSGDALFAPSEGSWPVQVMPAAGPIYECVGGGTARLLRIFVAVQAQASLPAVARAGAEVEVSNMNVRILAPRTPSGPNLLGAPGLPGYDVKATIALGPAGQAESVSFTNANVSTMTFDDGLGPDQIITFEGTAGEVTFVGAPGDVVEVDLSSFRMSWFSDTISGEGSMDCTPLESAAVLGTVALAGTTLAADAEVVEPGTPLALTAAALPAGAGAVEFRSGSQAIGVEPTADGSATFVIDDLDPGVHELTATFHGGVGVPKTTSEPVTVRVATCAAATGEGNEAAVRLMYLEILRRCPDGAGLAYWAERLDSGATTREQVTVQLAGSLEARRVYVDDAYRQMLGRRAEAAGRDFWAPRLATGRYDALLGDLAASGEFRRLAGGTDAGVVRRIYERVIGRSAESSGLAYWTGFMGDHGVSRLVRVLYNLPEPLAATVGNAYRDLIGRAPTGEEAAAGAELLKTTGNRGRLDGAIIATDDFDSRAQGIPELT